MVKRFQLLLLAGFLGLAASLSAQSLPTANLPWKQEILAKGLVWKNVHTDQLFNAKQHINILEINPKKHRFSLSYVVDTLVRTSSQAVRADGLAAVNAGFFDIQKGGSVTFLKVDGKVVNRTQPKLIQDKSEILRGALILGPGRQVSIEAAGPDSIYLHKKYPTVILTGPFLIDKGQAVALADRAFNTNRHPRTCACITDAKQVLLITVDGRTNESFGMSLGELSSLLQSLGCRQAVNLDGGGSTTMWIKGKPDSGVVNMPCDNKKFDHLGERPVANAVIVH